MGYEMWMAFGHIFGADLPSPSIFWQVGAGCCYWDVCDGDLQSVTVQGLRALEAAAIHPLRLLN